MSQPVDPQVTREIFRNRLGLLFDQLRAAGQWDYVLIDTRGGFGFNTTDVCALSDSFFLVTEPDFTSFYQDKNLMFRITAAATELTRRPVFRGVIVNKATEFLPTEDGAKLGLHNLNLDNIEASFRNVLVDEFSIRYADTNPVPLSIEAVQAYKQHKVPYISSPGSVFSYATLVAFSNLMKTVTARWSDETTKRWNELVDRISNAIKIENERKLASVREQQALQNAKEKLESENQFLNGQISDLKKSLDNIGENEKLRLSRDQQLYENQRSQDDRHRSQERSRLFLLSSFTAVIIVLFGAFSWLVYSNLSQQQADLRATIAKQDSMIAQLQQQISAATQRTTQP
jgi:cell division protein FtsB